MDEVWTAFQDLTLEVYCRAHAHTDLFTAQAQQGYCSDYFFLDLDPS